MQIGGLQKTTLIDFPGEVACSVFTVGCNFACPFCHNRELVTQELFEESGRKTIDEEEFWSFLERRKKILDGVCITGGEPTLQSDLVGFCQKVQKIGLKVKLDTNGSRPEILEKLFKKKLVDFVAMDYKTLIINYELIINNKGEELTKKIKKSMRLIVDSGIEYEFRTTVVPRIHNLEVLTKMLEEINQISKIKYQKLIKNSKLLAGKPIWIWQNFRPKNCLDESWNGERSYAREEIIRIRNRVSRKIKLKGW